MINTVVDTPERGLADPRLDHDRLKNVVEGIRRHICATMSLNRADRLFPAHFMVFETNSVNLAYGACGVSLFLHETIEGVPEDVISWIFEGLERERLPPALYAGVAGVAYVLARIGYLEEGTNLLLKSVDDPLLSRESNFYRGLAGWGWSSLALYQLTHEEQLLKHAETVGQELLNRAMTSSEGIYWILEEDGRDVIPLGLGWGASGVALFLTALGKETGKRRYMLAARSALKFDLSQANDARKWLRWGTDVGDTGTRPYLIKGSCGVALSLLRYYQSTGDESMLEAACSAARGMKSLFSAFPGVFLGMSGIGPFLIDMYLETGVEQFLRQAEVYIGSILCTVIEREDGIAFPGNFHSRICTDYATGSAGVGLFLNRYLNPKPRTIYDLP